MDKPCFHILVVMPLILMMNLLYLQNKNTGDFVTISVNDSSDLCHYLFIIVS